MAARRIAHAGGTRMERNGTSNPRDARKSWRALAPLGANLEVFEVFGTTLCFNTTTCAFLEVDSPTAQVLRSLHAGASYEQALGESGLTGSPDTFEEIVEEISCLTDAGYLSDSDPLSVVRRTLAPPLSSLCLVMATGCNLRCRYCYAEDGTYRLPPAVMSRDTGQAAVDLLMRKSRGLKEVGIGFFGGEPLLNYRVITELVPYAEEQANRLGKQCGFSLTTNGTLLTPEKVAFFEKHPFAYIVSLDGSKEHNDRNRRFRSGAGTYDTIVRHLREVTNAFPAFAPKVTLRATFTGQEHDLAGILAHLRELGFRKVSVEPCSAMSALGGIREADLPDILADYDAAAQWYLGLLAEGGEFSFFHMQQLFSQVAKGERRITQCGAGCGYLAVAPDGTLYPCHRLLGSEGWAMGTVFTDLNREIQSRFIRASVPYKEPCRACWARYICGGGCHATALQFNGSILEPHRTECLLMKHRIRLGAWIYSRLSDLHSQGLRQPDDLGRGFASSTAEVVPASFSESPQGAGPPIGGQPSSPGIGGPAAR